MFVVQARLNRFPIFFGKSTPKLELSLSDSGKESYASQFDFHESNSRKIMEIMGLDFTKCEGLWA